MCSDSWPLNESEPGVDLAVMTLIRKNLRKKSSEVFKSSLTFIHWPSKHTTVK